MSHLRVYENATVAGWDCLENVYGPNSRLSADLFNVLSQQSNYLHSPSDFGRCLVLLVHIGCILLVAHQPSHGRREFR